ncbi:MAG TPA: hypothetical protein VKA30_04575, partial [Actinomycetota bacterium]|nr:hypothetical protein [Actinomycetota bacterium]
FDDEDRARFVESLRGALNPGGRYFMLCFSELVPGDMGPRRISEAEIRSSFQDGWRIVSLERDTMEVNFVPDGIPGWLATIERVNSGGDSPLDTTGNPTEYP